MLFLMLSCDIRESVRCVFYSAIKEFTYIAIFPNECADRYVCYRAIKVFTYIHLYRNWCWSLSFLSCAILEAVCFVFYSAIKVFTSITICDNDYVCYRAIKEFTYIAIDAVLDSVRLVWYRPSCCWSTFALLSTWNFAIVRKSWLFWCCLCTIFNLRVL